MTENERQDFVKNEMGAIYEEFNACLNQMILLKPFMKNLVEVASGSNQNID